MLSVLEATPGLNTATFSSQATVVELTGTINGHTALFIAGSNSIAVTSEEDEVSEELYEEEESQDAPWPRKMPNRRGGFNQILRMPDGMKLYLRTGEYADGSLGEIFIDCQKEGTFARSMLNCFAMAISTGLQHGVPLTVFSEHFKHTMFEPKGVINGSDVVTEATSIIDAIFQELDAAYPEGKAVTPAAVRPLINYNNE